MSYSYIHENLWEVAKVERMSTFRTFIENFSRYKPSEVSGSGLLGPVVW
jgi:hypothetical protein